MDYSKSWVVPATVGITIAVPLATFVAILVREQIVARRNRIYKTLADHTILNAGDREAWMSGVLPSGEEEPVSRFSTLIAPMVQLATVVLLAIIVITSNASLNERIAHQDDQIADLATQVHALAFASTPAPRQEADPALPPVIGAMANASPMQQACANLIGRVADAYEKGESSKIGEALEGLVQKLKCVNPPQQP